MSSGLTYLITGANRGIGLGLTGSLLLRPNTTVVATVRSLNPDITSALHSLPTHPTSNLIILPLPMTSHSENDDDTPFHSLSLALKTTHSLPHLDIVIANAGTSTLFSPILTTPPSALRADHEINTLGPLQLFQATYGLLAASPMGAPKFVLISSALGSIGGLDANAGPSLAYGTSKAAANYLVRKIHFEHEEVVAVAIHPGWVKTAMGQGYADAVSVKEPPMELEDCVKGLLEQIDAATKHTTSGSFISYDGTTIPW